jgi:haloacetate dehalogenase
MFFDGFELSHVNVAGGAIRLRHGGSGPPLLLLHGNPQTHAMWHAVAPELAKTYTVICPDLRGYGGSFKPPVIADHAAYSKAAMSRDMAALMTQLGHERFLVAAHDRGARVAHRLAIDHPARIEKLCLLDIVPTIEHFERADMAFGLGYYHWFWFAQPHPFPENIISASPDVWFKAHTSREAKDDNFFHAQALSDYLEWVRKPETIIGMCEDYRAAATIDLVHDRVSRAAGDKIKCPLHVLWGSKGKIGVWYDALEVWSRYCNAPVSGRALPAGHYLAEETPGLVTAELLRFFA